MSTEERTVRIIKADKSPQNSTLRVAAYCRVSTSEEDQLNSFITQMHYYHDFISQSDNMVLVDIYADEGITGTSVEKRNEFKRMLNDCRLGKIDRIYVKSAFVQSEALATSKRVSTMNRMRLEIGRYSKNKVSKEKCLSHSMSEEVIGRTFIRFYNKLRQNENVLLKDIAAKLTEARRIITCSDSLISEIDREISVLSEKLNLYISLQKESCMDAVTFSEQCSKLENSLLKLKSRRKKVLAEDGDEKCIDELRRVIRFLETKPKAIIVFSRPLFDELIDKAYFEDEYVTFYLKCGLAFKERIAWN